MCVQRLSRVPYTVLCGQVVHIYDPITLRQIPSQLWTSAHSSISAAAAAYFNGIEFNKMKMIPTVENSGFLPMTINFHVNWRGCLNFFYSTWTWNRFLEPYVDVEKKKHDLIFFFLAVKKQKKDIGYPTFGGPLESLCRHNFIERFVLASNPEWLSVSVSILTKARTQILIVSEKILLHNEKSAL